MIHRVLCTALSSDTGPHFDLLRQAGFDVEVVDPKLDLWQASSLIASLQGFHAVVAGSEPYSAEVIAACPDLRVIARAGVGFDAVDLSACDERRIVLCTTPGVNHHAVAEHTIAMLVAVARGFPRRDQQVRQGIWQRSPTCRIHGRTLGLVGFGRIGQATASRGIGLGMQVVACDPLADPEFAAEQGVRLVSQETLLRSSDFVSLHAPDLPETRHVINDTTLGLMKQGAILINTARGSLVDEDALIRSLQSGHLGGAGLDVFRSEPLSVESPLITMDNVLLSGHVAGLDNESHRDTYVMIAETIIRLRDGEWPTDCIQNLQQTTDWKW